MGGRLFHFLKFGAFRCASISRNNRGTTMGDYVALRGGDSNGVDGAEAEKPRLTTRPNSVRIASLDVFRGLSIALMIFVDYAGSVLPSVGHSPWNGIRLADYVMPFFLFIAGISIAIVYKRTPNRLQATYKSILRAMKLFLLGVLLQGGYFHGINTLTFGIDIEKIRWFGILQRIAVGYIVAALCEIWSLQTTPMNLRSGLLYKYVLMWVTIFLLTLTYTVLLYGLYVPDWEFFVQSSTSFGIEESIVRVNCSVRGDLGPACNSAGMIDRSLLGIEHLYKKPTYRNLKECVSLDAQPGWCLAPFDPEGILSSFMAAITCLFGLHCGHVLVQVENHKNRLHHWLIFLVSLLALGIIFALAGISPNKSLYTISYTLITTATAGITFCALYLLVDVYQYRKICFVLEWMGRHALSIFVLIASNLAVIAIQGFYWQKPQNNIVHWVVSFVKK